MLTLKSPCESACVRRDASAAFDAETASSDVGELPIGGFLPLTLSDFPATSAAMVFVRGCTMRCPYCHNRHLWDDGPTIMADEILARIAHRRRQIPGVVVSGGEPTMHAGLNGFLRALRALGMRIKLDTNGSRPQTLAALLDEGMIDFVALDAKAGAAHFAAATGAPHLADRVADALRILRARRVPYELRTTVCGGLHDVEHLRAILAGLEPGERWFLQAYVPAPAGNAAGLREPDAGLLAAIRAEARARGVRAEIR